MADLAEKFFAEDLTEAEEQALAESLWSSDEQALKFGRLAEEAYARYGLPEPSEPGAGSGPSLGEWAWRGFLVLAGLGVLLYFLKAPREVAAPVPAPAVIATPAPAAPAPRRMPVAKTPVADYNLLKVVVSRDVAGPVVIRVLSPEGREVRRLFDGSLEAGKWAFRWDGKLSDGTTARPGIYTIEIDNGRAIQTRRVQIQ